MTRGMPSALSHVAGKMIFHEQLPICGELLWIEVFNTFCLAFCYVSLFESIVVLYLAFKDEDTLLPSWMVDLLIYMHFLPPDKEMRIAKQLIGDRDATSELNVDELNFESSASMLFRVYNGVVMTEEEACAAEKGPLDVSAHAKKWLSNAASKKSAQSLPEGAELGMKMVGEMARQGSNTFVSSMSAMKSCRSSATRDAPSLPPSPPQDVETATLSAQRGMSVSQYRQAAGSLTPAQAAKSGVDNSEGAGGNEADLYTPSVPSPSGGSRVVKVRRRKVTSKAGSTLFSGVETPSPFARAPRSQNGDAGVQYRLQAGAGNRLQAGAGMSAVAANAAAMDRARTAKFGASPPVVREVVWAANERAAAEEPPKAEEPPTAEEPPKADAKKLRWVRDVSGFLRPTRELTNDDISRLVFFELLYFMLDVDKSGGLTLDEATKALSYLAPEMSYRDRLPMMLAVDDGDGQLQRWEWVELCVSALWHYPIAQLEMAAKNYQFAYSYKLETNRQKWRAVAKRVDAYSRFFVIMAYAVVFGLLFGVEFTDPYSAVPREENQVREFIRILDWDLVMTGQAMFHGVYYWIFTTKGIAIAMIAPAFLFILASMWLVAIIVVRRRPGIRALKLKDIEAKALDV